MRIIDLEVFVCSENGNVRNCCGRKYPLSAETGRYGILAGYDREDTAAGGNERRSTADGRISESAAADGSVSSDIGNPSGNLYEHGKRRMPTDDNRTGEEICGRKYSDCSYTGDWSWSRFERDCDRKKRAYM